MRSQPSTPTPRGVTHALFCMPLLVVLAAAASAAAPEQPAPAGVPAPAPDTAPAPEAPEAPVPEPPTTAAPGAIPAPDSPAALPFLPVHGAGDRFAVSTLTKRYDAPLVTFASQSSSRSPRTLEWLDNQARIAAAAAAAEAADSSNVRLATGGKGEAATIPPEEKKSLEPPKPPIAVGIPSPVAIAGALAGGIVMLVKLIAALSR